MILSNPIHTTAVRYVRTFASLILSDTYVKQLENKSSKMLLLVRVTPTKQVIRRTTFCCILVVLSCLFKLLTYLPGHGGYSDL